MYQIIDDKRKWRPAGNSISANKIVGQSEELLAVQNEFQELQYDNTVGALVLKIVALLERVEISELKNTSRGKADICLARQMAMYLMHTVFSSPYHRVARFFNRDRTTISHACKLVEDLRDNEPFDKSLEAMENLLVSARALYEIVERSEADGR